MIEEDKSKGLINWRVYLAAEISRTVSSCWMMNRHAYGKGGNGALKSTIAYIQYIMRTSTS